MYKDKEKHKEKCKEYYHNHKDELKEKYKIYRQKYNQIHKEKKSIKDKEYKSKHKEELKKHHKEYYNKNKQNLIDYLNDKQCGLINTKNIKRCYIQQHGWIDEPQLTVLENQMDINDISLSRDTPIDPKNL